MGAFQSEIIINKFNPEQKSKGDSVFGCRAKEREDVTVAHLFDIVNLAMEPLGIDSLM